MQMQKENANISSSLNFSSKLLDTERLNRIRNPQNRRFSVVLPNDIPWEYGSNKYACQTGSGGFGTIRRSVPNIQSSRHLSESNDGVVPWHSCPPLKSKTVTQAGHTPFGSFREQVTQVKEHENEKKKDIQLLIVDPKSSNSCLKLWNQSNPEAKNHTLHGRHRQTVFESTGGRKFTYAETRDCKASLPRFQCLNESSAAKDCQKRMETLGISRRQVTTFIRGLPITAQEKLDSNKCMTWLGGKVTLQSQSKTGGFNKTRDVVSPSYYSKFMSEKEMGVKHKNL